MNCAPYLICASIPTSVQRQRFAFMLFLRSLLPKPSDFLKWCLVGSPTQSERRSEQQLPSDLDGDYSAFSYIVHQVVIHTLRWGFYNGKIGGVKFAYEKRLRWAMISVKRCVFVTGASLETWRLFVCSPHKAAWFFPPVSKMALAFIFRACSGLGSHSWMPEIMMFGR